MSLPIQFKELLQLQQIGIPMEAIAFTTVTMESERYICIRDITKPEKFVVIIDLKNTGNIVREKISADSAIMNPSKNILALKATNTLQVFDMGVREKLNENVMTEPVVFWKWINTDTIALVTASSVYHWDQREKGTKPKKVFGRLPNMNASQIINYRVDPTGKWCVLIGISKEGDKIVGSMQLYSIEKKISQNIPGHAASFIRFPVGNKECLLFCFASRGVDGSAKMYIIEIGNAPGEQNYERKQSDIYFPPEASIDFPVAIQTSDKYKVVYMITKFGYIHIFDVGTGKLIFMNRISADAIFVTVPHVEEGGIIGINRKGQVLSISVDPKNVIPYICSELKDYDLAMKFATMNNLPGAEDLYIGQFNQFVMQGKIKEAAEVAADSPSGLLRNAQTINKFKQMPPINNQPPLLIYFTVLLEKGKLNKIESLELVRPVLAQGRKELLEDWLKQDKVECSEELGDVVRPFDTLLALSIYFRAQAKAKVVACLAESGQYDKIKEYAGSVEFNPDYLSILNDLVLRNNRQAAFDLAMKVYKDGGRSSEEVAKVIALFMSRNMLKETTSLLLDVLKGDKPEEKDLQTKLLEINLIQAPQVAAAIFANDMFHHYDKNYIAGLCEKAGLFQHALSNYTAVNDRKRVLVNAHAVPPEFLVNWFGQVDPEEGIILLGDMMRTNRANIPMVVEVASKNSEKYPVDQVISLLESFNSFEGVYAYLSTVVDYSQDPEVHFKFIEAATKVGKFQDVERICRESKVYDPVRVRDFLMAARLPDQLPLILVCDMHDFVPELTKYLYDNSLNQFIERYVTQIRPVKTPKVVGALLDADCNEEYIKKLVVAVGNLCPVDELVQQVEKRNRLRLLQPWLESLAQHGNQEPATHNALAKIYINESKDPEKFLLTNAFYDSRVVGKYCENRDPHLAYVAYKRGLCDKELVEVTNKNALFKSQARYLTERQSPELWALVLREENEFRKPVLDQVVQTALPESKNPEEVSSTVKALMNADMPEQLIELLEKIILEGSEFGDNKNLQNLLILTAIKANQAKVMDYINRLDNYDGEDIAEIAVNNKLYEEAFQIFKKFNLNEKAVIVLIENLGDLERALEYAETVKAPKVWSILAEGQLATGDIQGSIDSYMKANDASNYVEVILSAEKEALWEPLVKFLHMCRLHTKEPHIESELIYALAKVENLASLEEFITGPNCAQIQVIGDRCFDEGMYEAAQLLYSNISNYPKLASTLVKLKKYSSAVDAARQAKSTRTWKEVCKHLIDAKEFRLAQLCALHIIINGDELDNLIHDYEVRGYFDEIIAVLETGLASDRSHVGMFTELAGLYSKYRPEKLMQHLQLFHGSMNIPKVIRYCNTNQQWQELAFLYDSYKEHDNAVLTMITHSVEAWDHNKFEETIAKVKNTDILYKAVRFYLKEHPLLTNDLLSKIVKRVDHEKVVRIVDEQSLLPLIKPYLVSIQDTNLAKVNTALNDIYVEEEDFEALRHSIDTHDNFEPIRLARKLRQLKELEFRRIAAYLYRKNEKWVDSVELSKEDKLYKDAMETVAESGDAELAESLLRYFIKEDLKECFSACLYTCYDLVKPDVAMELAWKAGVTDLAMPYLIQVVREYTSMANELRKERKEREQQTETATFQPGPVVVNGPYTGPAPIGPIATGPILVTHTGMAPHSGPVVGGQMVGGPMVGGPMVGGPMVGGPMVGGPMVGVPMHAASTGVPVQTGVPLTNTPSSDGFPTNTTKSFGFTT